MMSNVKLVKFGLEFALWQKTHDMGDFILRGSFPNTRSGRAAAISRLAELDDTDGVVYFEFGEDMDRLPDDFDYSDPGSFTAIIGDPLPEQDPELPPVDTQLGPMVVIDTDMDGVTLAYPLPIKNDRVGFPVTITCRVVVGEGEYLFSVASDFGDTDSDMWFEISVRRANFRHWLYENVAPEIGKWVSDNLPVLRRKMSRRLLVKGQKAVMEKMKTLARRADEIERLAEMVATGNVDRTLLSVILSFIYTDCI